MWDTPRGDQWAANLVCIEVVVMVDLMVELKEVGMAKTKVAKMVD